MAKLDLNVLVIGAAVVGGLYFANRLFKANPENVEERQEGMTDRVEIRQENRTERVELWTETIKDLFGGSGSTDINKNQLLGSAQISGSNPITSIYPTGSAFNMPVVTVRDSSGRSSSIIAAKDTYYPTLAVGFDSKGAGYSSAFAGNKAPTTTTQKAQLITALSTKKPFGV